MEHHCRTVPLETARHTVHGGYMHRIGLKGVLGAVLVLVAAATVNAQGTRPAVKTPRIYVFDGGVLASETARYRLTDADVQEVSISVRSEERRVGKSVDIACC